MLALLFPGQGSQEVGMGLEASRVSAAAREVFERADSALGFSISKLCFEGPEDELRRTEIQQPAILATSVALLRMLEERGEWPVRPAFVAGHSLGEYTALVSAGSLSLEDAVRLVHARGRYMQEAVPEGRGAMAAILGGKAEDIALACEQASRETERLATPANFNSPQQVVIAGDAVAVERACSRALDAGARRAVPLPVSAPFHCALMKPAADKLALDLERVRFASPSPAVVTNVEAEPNLDAARIPELLREQVTAPVRFTEMVEKLCASGVTHFLEIGPGKVLTGLVARIQRRVARASLASSADLESAWEFLGSTTT